MNPQINRVFGAIAIGFALLIALTTYWQVWAAPSLAARQDNLREVVREQSIERGLIQASDGTRLALSRKAKTRDGRTVWIRHYPTRKMFAPVVGFSSVTANRSGLEQSMNDYLTGANTDLSGFLDRQLRSISGQSQRGNNVITTLSTRAQRTAMSELAASGYKGAVAALDPRSGDVLALASWPSYDPNLAVKGGKAWDALLRSREGALLNRATQGRYPPGSTFKVVTAAEGLRSGKYRPDSVFVDKGYYVEYGQKIYNFGRVAHGVVTLTEALTHSINSVFAEIGATLCPTSRCEPLGNQMVDLGFYARPELELPADEVLASGVARPGGVRLQGPYDPIDPARTAIGQYRLQVTPLQMAMVAAAVANRGKLMRPTLLGEVRTPSGRLITRGDPEEMGQAMPVQTADELGRMMGDVVAEGTGTAAALQGISVAGKSGTAETGHGSLNDAWFIAFAPIEDPQIAVAVVLEDTPGFGGTSAAPIAAKVIESVLG